MDGITRKDELDDPFRVGGLNSHAQERIVAFRALPSRSRQAFLAIALDKIEFMDLVGTGQWTDEELREGVLASLEALLGRKRTHGGEL